MFSPKVLDRANVIEFNEVDLEGYTTGISHDDAFCLDTPDVRNALIDLEVSPFCSRGDYSRFKEIFEGRENPFQELVSRLKTYNLHFGYRVVNEMSRFVWMAQGACGEHFELSDAIDIQILQKVLPKFHGTQGKLQQPLSDLLHFCFDETDKTGKPSEDLLQKAQSTDNGATYPRSARKIARMIQNLKIQGYTSFIE